MTSSSRVNDATRPLRRRVARFSLHDSVLFELLTRVVGTRRKESPAAEVAVPRYVVGVVPLAWTTRRARWFTTFASVRSAVR
jgi:hypothetical protein